jgi:hypothetical protein
MDVLADVLDLSRVRGALLANVRAGAPWGLELPRNDGASFHAVLSGTTWLRVADREPLQLRPVTSSSSRPVPSIACRPSPMARAGLGIARSRSG